VKPTFPENCYFRLEKYIGYVSHISKKGQVVGYVFYDGKWWGQVVWRRKTGCSELQKSDFNVLGGTFRASNCLHNFGPIDLTKTLPLYRLKKIKPPREKERP
jgi:hypothetical protein